MTCARRGVGPSRLTTALLLVKADHSFVARGFSTALPTPRASSPRRFASSQRRAAPTRARQHAVRRTAPSLVPAAAPRLLSSLSVPRARTLLPGPYSAQLVPALSLHIAPRQVRGPPRRPSPVPKPRSPPPCQGRSALAPQSRARAQRTKVLPPQRPERISASPTPQPPQPSTWENEGAASLPLAQRLGQQSPARGRAGPMSPRLRSETRQWRRRRPRRRRRRAGQSLLTLNTLTSMLT